MSSSGTFSLTAVSCNTFTANAITDYGALTVNGAATLNSTLSVAGNAWVYGGTLTMRGGGSNDSYIRMNYNNDTALTELRSTDTFSPAHVGGTFSIIRGGVDTQSLTVYGSGATFSSYGYNGKAGIYGGPQSNCWNFEWGSGLYGWIDNTNLGPVSFTSDYRIKQNVENLPTMWGKVKALRPIKYNLKDFSPTDPPCTEHDGSEISEPRQIPLSCHPMFTADDKEHWGFIAHELQETLIEDAATGTKDAANILQSPNPWTMLAAVTKALQEAMARIEQLEMRLGMQR
jgi:hypothetical protein